MEANFVDWVRTGMELGENQYHGVTSKTSQIPHPERPGGVREQRP
jgi:hypothetical protein